tara:strand:+ start:556 stop:771 length:216 start_codon:yes stop_codon:yes gene_type:complete
MIDTINAGDLVWVPSRVKAHSRFARSLITKLPRNFLVTGVENNDINILIDGREWTVKRVDVYPPRKAPNEW